MQSGYEVLPNIILGSPWPSGLGRWISVHLIIRSSHRCDWCRFEPRTGHMWDKPSSACGRVRWFSRGTPVSPHLPIGSSRYEWNNLERDVKQQKIFRGRALLVKMLITLEPHGIFGSNFVYYCILTLPSRWYAKRWWSFTVHHFGRSNSFDENAYNSWTVWFIWLKKKLLIYFYIVQYAKQWRGFTKHHLVGQAR